MTVLAAKLTPADELPVYPIEKTTRLTAHYFTMWWHDRWLNSVMHLKGSYEVQGVAVALFSIAQRQSPIGTLPEDESLIARMLRIDLDKWRDLMSLSINPLHNWERCLCGNEVRLMHPVVTEVALDAINKRDVREAANNARAEEMRLRRLREGLEALGCDRRVILDDVLMNRLDGWLLETCRGNRTRLVYERALMFAKRAGWLGGANSP